MAQQPSAEGSTGSFRFEPTPIHLQNCIQCVQQQNRTLNARNAELRHKYQELGATVQSAAEVTALQHCLAVMQEFCIELLRMSEDQLPPSQGASHRLIAEDHRTIAPTSFAYASVPLTSSLPTDSLPTGYGSDDDLSTLRDGADEVGVRVDWQLPDQGIQQ